MYAHCHHGSTPTGGQWGQHIHSVNKPGSSFNFYISFTLPFLALPNCQSIHSTARGLHNDDVTGVSCAHSILSICNAGPTLFESILSSLRDSKRKLFWIYKTLTIKAIKFTFPLNKRGSAESNCTFDSIFRRKQLIHFGHSKWKQSRSDAATLTVGQKNVFEWKKWAQCNYTLILPIVMTIQLLLGYIRIIDSK